MSCGHQHIPQVIHEHGKPWWNDVGSGKLLIRTPELSLEILPAKPSSSKSGGSGQIKL
jgi:hypothetical protein